MRSAATTYEGLALRPGARVDALMDAAVAYGGLGDELGQSGMASLSDPVAALAAFHKSLELDERIVHLDPHFTRALRGLAVNHAKIANIELDTEPAAALLDYGYAIRGMNALPDETRNTLPNQRTLANFLSKNALALKEVGRYQEALSYLENAKAIARPFLIADPNDTRAANDMLSILENEAECFEDRAQGVFIEGKTNRKADAASALRALSEARFLTERLLLLKPDNLYWRSTLGLLLVRMSIQQTVLHRADEEALQSAEKGLAILKSVGGEQNVQGFDLDAVATGLTIVTPVRLRDPQLAVDCAERLVEMSHHQKPGFFLTLARAYRAAGRAEKARAAAREGLTLLPTATAATVTSRIRKQLQAELAGLVL
jgi:tetratricopeptide (TPR) repeat protein